MNNQKSATESSIKTASEKRPARGRHGVRLQDVLAVLPRSETRSLAMTYFRENGGDRDRFYQSANKAIMAAGLTKAEDWLELHHRKAAEEREAMQAVRRRLEDECSR